MPPIIVKWNYITMDTFFRLICSLNHIMQNSLLPPSAFSAVLRALAEGLAAASPSSKKVRQRKGTCAPLELIFYWFCAIKSYSYLFLLEINIFSWIKSLFLVFLFKFIVKLSSRDFKNRQCCWKKFRYLEKTSNRRQ